MDQNKLADGLDAAYEELEDKYSGDIYPDKGPVEIATIMTRHFIGICLERGILAPGPKLGP